MKAEDKCKKSMSIFSIEGFLVVSVIFLLKYTGACNPLIEWGGTFSGKLFKITLMS